MNQEAQTDSEMEMPESAEEKLRKAQIEEYDSSQESADGESTEVQAAAFLQRLLSDPNTPESDISAAHYQLVRRSYLYKPDETTTHAADPNDWRPLLKKYRALF